MEEEINRWTARRKSALVMEILQGKKTVAEANREFDLTPSEIEAPIEQEPSLGCRTAAGLLGMNTPGEAYALAARPVREVLDHYITGATPYIPASRKESTKGQSH